MSPPYSKTVIRSLLQAYMFIHQYYVQNEGLDELCQKVLDGEFGYCPRVLCDKTTVLPYCKENNNERSRLRLYCPWCKQSYSRSEKINKVKNTSNSLSPQIDESFFGPGIHLKILQKYSQLNVDAPLKKHEPKIYGYKIKGYYSSLDSDANKT